MKEETWKHTLTSKNKSSHQWPWWTKRKHKEWVTLKKEIGSVDGLKRLPNPFSFSIIKMCSPNCPSAKPQTIASSSLFSIKRTIFSTELCGLVFGFYLSWSEYRRENRKARRTFLPLPFILVISCSSSFYCCVLLFLALSLSLLSLTSCPTFVINLLVTFTFSFWFFVCGLLCYFLIWWGRWKGLCLWSVHLMLCMRIRRLR